MNIEVIQTAKNKLKDRFNETVQKKILPEPTTSTIIVGSSGSGKTNLLANLLSRQEMLGNQFNEIFCISLTGDTDDVMEHLNLPKENLFTDIEQGIKHMEKIFEIQKIMIKHLGEDACPLVCLIYDDCISSRVLLKSNFFLKSFIMSRHYNCSTFILTQYYKQVPASARNQCNNIIWFANSATENEKLADVYTPNGYSKKEFLKMIEDATREPYSFLYINKKAPMSERYRIRFDKIMKLSRLADTEQQSEPEQSESDKPEDPNGLKEKDSNEQ